MGLLTISPSHAQWFIETVDDGCCPSIAVESSGIAHISYLGPGGLKYANNSTGSWQIQTLDSNGGVRSSSIALDSDENVHISYALFNGTTYLLKYTNNITGSWMTPETVLESPDGCWSVSMDIDSNDKMHITYLEAPGVASGGDLLYVTNASGAWISETGPSAYDHASIAVDINDRVHISYYSIGGTQQGLFYLTKSPDGLWSPPEFVFTVGGQLEGIFTSIAAVSAPHISFVGGTMEDNMYAKKKPDGTWFLGQLDLGGFSSAGNSIALDPNGHVHVCYYHKATGNLRYQSSAYGPMGVNLSRTVDTGGYSNSLGVDRSGIAHISYDSAGKIKYATPAPDILVSPESLDLGAVEIGSTSAPLEVTVSNEGLGNLIIDSVVISGEDADEFGQSNDCSTVVYGESCTVTVTFTPNSAGKKSTTLTVSSNDPDTPNVTVPLSGVVPNDWVRTYGGLGDDKASSIQPTADGGYIIAGIADSFGSGGDETWIVKLDEKGDIEWQKTYNGGGYLNDHHAIVQTSDLGYMVATNKWISGERHDLWLLRLNGNGDIEWQKTYGIEIWHGARSIQQTSDGGFIVAGYVWLVYGAPDFWILKLDDGGNIEWQKRCGVQFSSNKTAYSIQQTSDGGYVVAGTTTLDPSSIRQTGDGGYIVATSYFSVLVLKLDASGETQWQKSYTSLAPFGPNNFWVLKLNSEGAVSWQKGYDNGQWEEFHALQTTSDGGFILAGFTGSSALTSGNDRDAWILKLDSNGNIQWQKTYGGNYDERVFSIRQTADAGYIAAGLTNSFGVEEPGSENYNAWVLKLDENGDVSGCPSEIILESNASVADTQSTVSDYTITCWDTDVSPQDSNVPVFETMVTPDDICPYDGNQDGIPDNQQDNVAPISTIGGIVTLVSPDGTTLSGVQSVDNPSPTDTPADIDFPFGFLEFTLNGVGVGGAASINLHLPAGESVETYYKYGPTPDDPTPHWYEFLYDGQTGAEINGNVIALHFVDGQRGDKDITANGIIVEPGAPSLSLATPGDLDGDEDIDLIDAILALRVLAGIEPSSIIHKGADVNGNGKLGMEETIFILQTVSGLRAGGGP